MSFDPNQVSVIIPTLNEEPTIGHLIHHFITLGYSDILVIDGKSTDKTRTIAEKAGARVVIQKGKGKGNAFIQAITMVNRPYVLLIDGDGTYDPEEGQSLILPLLDGYDQVIGNRLTRDNHLAFHHLNLAGNQILNYLFKIAHGQYLFDILSGYRSFTLESLHKMKLTEEGFGIETEISSEAVKNNNKISVIPVKYGVRVGSDTKLDPIHDGLKIGRTIYRLGKMNNPMFYFGFIGLAVFLLGACIGVYVVLDWFKEINHIPLTILTVALIIVGLQIFMFGIQTDMMLAYQREMIQEIQNLNKK